MTGYHLQPDPTAVMGRRIVAHLIDVIVGTALGLLTYLITSLPELTADNINDFEQDQRTIEVSDTIYVLEPAAGAVWIVVGLYIIAILVVLQGLTGLTIGKAITGIRAVAEDGNVPGLARSLVRTLAWIADGILALVFVSVFGLLGALLATPAVPFVGLVVALAARGHRRIGDIVAKTFVVDSDFAGRPVLLSGTSVIAGQPEDTTDLVADLTDSATASAEVEAEAKEKGEEPVGAGVKSPAATAASAAIAAAARAQADKTATTDPTTSTAPTPESKPASGGDDDGGRPAAEAPAAGSTTSSSPTGTDDETSTAPPKADTSETDAPETDGSKKPAPSPAGTESEVDQEEGAKAADEAKPAETEAQDEQPLDDGDARDQAGDASTDAASSLDDDAIAYEPEWDDARGAYIVWDTAREEWLQFDAESDAWGPISQ